MLEPFFILVLVSRILVQNPQLLKNEIYNPATASATIANFRLKSTNPHGNSPKGYFG